MIMEKNRNTTYFEGCGREGPINCIFLTEFHHTAGPKITCQVPEDYIPKDTFEAVSVYIIPKAQLQRSTLTITVWSLKILGFPVRIDNKKYARNAFYFNLCFVFDSWARTVQYEPLVKKLSEYLTAMEVESNFLSQQEQNSSYRTRLVSMLKQVLHDLNNHKMCTLSVFLEEVVGFQPPQEQDIADKCISVRPCDRVGKCQTINSTCNNFRFPMWREPSSTLVLPYIDGMNHVAKIASEADVENNLVKSCLQNLVYYGLVSMVPIFQYSNMYTVTPKLRRLAVDKRLQDECLRTVAKTGRQIPCLRDVFRMYAGMTHGTTVRDLCLRFDSAALHIDERRLVQFGVLEGLIRRIERFPVVVTESPTGPLQTHFAGLHSVDELCCLLGLRTRHLLDQVDRDPNTVFIWK